MIKLLNSTVADRQWCLRIAGKLRRDPDIGMLVATTSDPDPRVRAVAAEQLAHLAGSKSLPVAAQEALTRSVHDRGMLVPRFVAAALAGASKAADFTPTNSSIDPLRALSSSISADVRAYATAASAAVPCNI